MALVDRLEQIEVRAREALLALTADAIDGEALSEIDTCLRQGIIFDLPRKALAAGVRDIDDGVDFLADPGPLRR